MLDSHDLESLYTQARQALKARDYDRASDLLRQILLSDEDYKDASRLLAQSVKFKRRRWYNDPRLWGTLGFMVVVALGFFIAPRLRGFYTAQPTAPVVSDSPTAMLPPTINATATETPLPTPTPVPLTWKRISLGREFQRDTVTAFATDKKDPDVIYAAMKNAGVYKTIDGGLSWRPAHYGLSNAQVVSLLIDSEKPRILYAGTMDDGVFKTEDGGGNWFRISEGAYLLMDMQDNSHLYARDGNGIYETIDQGSTWTQAYILKKDCPDEILAWAIHPAEGNTLFIGGGETCAGVYQSSDGGSTWALKGLADKPNLDALAIGLDEQGNFSIYVDIYVDFDSPILFEERNGIFASHDGGANWSRTGIWGGCDILTSDSENPATIYCAGNRLRVIRKKGDPWQDVPGTHSITFSTVHIDRPNGTDRIIMGGTDVSTTSDPNVGIFISEDGGASWVQRDKGLGSTRAELKIDPLDSSRIYLATYFADAGAECRLYRSLDNGKSWPLIKWRGGDWCGPTFDAAHVLYMKEQGALQKSWDGGETWLWDSRDLSEEERRLNYSVALKYALPSPEGSQSVSANPYAAGFIYDVGQVIYYSTDAGVSWQLSEGSEGSWDARLFYAAQGKMIFAIGRYHQSYSTDSGKTWQICGEDVTTSRSDTRLTLGAGGSRLYLATSGNGVVISTDQCQSWQASNEGLSNLFVNTLAIDPRKPETIYAGTDSGAYVSFDSGESWSQINDGLLGATVVYSIAVDKDSNVYAATPYGVFKLEGK